MKKFLSFALAIVLVLAMSSVAYAANWNQVTNTDIASPVKIAVSKWTQNGDGLTQNIITNQTLYAGAPFCYAIKVEVPTYAALNAQYNTTEFFSGSKLYAKVTAVNIQNGIADITIPITVLDVAQTLYFNGFDDFTLGVKHNGNYAKYTGGVDFSVTVKYNTPMPMTFTSGTATYTVNKETNTYNVFESGYGQIAQFVCDKNGKCENLYIYVYGEKYQVKLSNGGAISFHLVGYAGSVGSSGYYYYGGQYDAMVAKTIADRFIVNVCGMDYATLLGKVIYVNDYNWAQNFGTVFTSTNNVITTNATDQPVITLLPTTPVTEVPSTGSFGVVGWTGVALALIGACLLLRNMKVRRKIFK